VSTAARYQPRSDNHPPRFRCNSSQKSFWIEEWRVERLIDALKLARASGIPIERLAGEAFKPERIPAAKSPASFHEDDEDRE
jgi:hypothetical protein